MSQGEWHAQVEEVQRRQDEDARLIEEHREWKEQFNAQRAQQVEVCNAEDQ